MHTNSHAKLLPRTVRTKTLNHGHFMRNSCDYTGKVNKVHNFLLRKVIIYSVGLLNQTLRNVITVMTVHTNSHAKLLPRTVMTKTLNHGHFMRNSCDYTGKVKKVHNFSPRKVITYSVGLLHQTLRNAITVMTVHTNSHAKLLPRTVMTKTLNYGHFIRNSCDYTGKSTMCTTSQQEKS